MKRVLLRLLLLLTGLWILPTAQAVARGAMKNEDTDNVSKKNGNPNEEVELDYNGLPRGSDIMGGFTKSHDSNDEECTDLAPDCGQRALDQGCITDFVNMEVACARTCLICGNQVGDKVFGLYHAEPQDIPVPGNSDDETLEVLEASDHYMFEVVYKEPEFESVMTRCKNQHASCSFWSAVGECYTNGSYMEVNCAPACQTCARLLFDERCPLTDEHVATSVWRRGSGSRMFETIITDPKWEAFNIQVLSQPDPPTSEIVEGPWVITLDDFLSAEECETLIQLGADQGYERSEDLSGKSLCALGVPFAAWPDPFIFALGSWF